MELKTKSRERVTTLPADKYFIMPDEQVTAPGGAVDCTQLISLSRRELPCGICLSHATTSVHEIVANDTTRNIPYRDAKSELTRLRRLALTQFLTAYGQWLRRYSAEKARIKSALTKQRRYRLVSVFSFNISVETMNVSPRRLRQSLAYVSQRNSRWESRGWQWLDAQDINGAWHGRHRTNSTLRGRLANFFAAHPAYRNNISVIFPDGNVTLYAKGAYVLERVRLDTDKRGKPRYSRNFLHVAMSDFLARDPCPKRSDFLSKEIQAARDAMNENIMFHYGRHIVSEDPIGLVDHYKVINRSRLVAPPQRLCLEGGVDGVRIYDYDSGTETILGSPNLEGRYQTVMNMMDGSYLIEMSEPKLSPSWNCVTFSDDESDTPDHIAHLKRSITDLKAGFVGGNPEFSLSRSIAELKDLPETIEVLDWYNLALMDKAGGNSTGLNLNWTRHLEGTPTRAQWAKSLKRTRAFGVLPRGCIQRAVALHLAWKFGVSPTISDVQTVLRQGLDWATTYRRGLRQLYSGCSDFIRTVTLRKRVFSRLRPVPSGIALNAEHGRLDVVSNFITDRNSCWRDRDGRQLQTPSAIFLRGADHGNPLIPMEITRPLWEDCYRQLMNVIKVHRGCYTDRCLLFSRWSPERIREALQPRGLSAQLTSMEPLTTAWELLPLSFIVDWFTNTRKVVSEISKRLSAFQLDIASEDKPDIWYSLNTWYAFATRLPSCIKNAEMTCTCDRYAWESDELYYRDGGLDERRSHSLEGFEVAETRVGWSGGGVPLNGAVYLHSPAAHIWTRLSLCDVQSEPVTAGYLQRRYYRGDMKDDEISSLLALIPKVNLRLDLSKLTTLAEIVSQAIAR